jgi:hypothetical protein
MGGLAVNHGEVSTQRKRPGQPSLSSSKSSVCSVVKSATQRTVTAYAHLRYACRIASILVLGHSEGRLCCQLCRQYGGLEYLEVNPEAERVALVLHWGGASGRVGLPFAALLPGWRVIAPSLRGHGRKPLPAVPVDVSGQDVAKLLAHLGNCSPRPALRLLPRCVCGYAPLQLGRDRAGGVARGRHCATRCRHTRRIRRFSR